MTLLIIFCFLILLGIFGAVIPGIPGLFYMFAMSLLYGFIDGWHHLTLSNIGILFVLALIGFCIDFFSGIIGAAYGGANKTSLVWGWIGLVLGTFLIPMPVIGSFIGLFLGVLLSELIIYKKRKKDAWKAALGGIIGALAGTFGNVFLAIVYFGLFLFFVVY